MPKLIQSIIRKSKLYSKKEWAVAITLVLLIAINNTFAITPKLIQDLLYYGVGLGLILYYTLFRKAKC